MAVTDAGLGLVVALAAACCYESSYAIQAFEARKTHPAAALQLALIAELVRTRWAVGIALAVAGWALQIAALGLAPLTLVQPVIASGLVLLLYLGHRVLGERVGTREIVGAVAIVVGVAGIAAAAPSHVDSIAAPAALAFVLCGLGGVTAAPYALRRGAGTHGVLLVTSAGAGDAWAALAAKLVSDDVAGGRPLGAVGWAVSAGIAVLLGLTSETTALQQLPATRVAPAVLAVQTAVPVLLAPLVVGEDWSATPLRGGLIAISLGVVVAGTAVVASSRLVGDLLAPRPAATSGAREDERRRRWQLGK